MTGRESCRFIRTYTELEGLQHAATVIYCAHTVPQGVVAQLRVERDGQLRQSTVLAPQGSFCRVMQLLRYLCENSIGPEQWLDVLEDAGQPFCRLEEGSTTGTEPGTAAKSRCFCGIC